MGEVSQTMYTCAKKKCNRRIGAVNQYHSVRHYFSHLTRDGSDRKFALCATARTPSLLRAIARHGRIDCNWVNVQPDAKQRPTHKNQ